MIDAALNALAVVTSPEHFVYLLAGVLVGMVIGILPGLGGMVGLALLMPLTYGLDPTSGIAMLVGMMSVTALADTYTAVLMGVPGSSASQATVMDGYPLARKGEGARALSAAFVSSMFGGLIGAAVLTLSLPFAVPMVLALGTPELLMLTFLALGMVAVLSGSNPFLGLVAALGGLALGTIGSAPSAATFRFTFGTDFLLDGVVLTSLAIGLFAIPEMIAVLTRGGAIAEKRPSLGGGWLQGLRDAARHKFIVLRHSLVGAMIGMLPGLGNAIIDWINYSLVIKLSKDKSQFGAGDVRGVIAPESATNAKEGGALIPTLVFGIPGSGSMALLLAALVIMGVEPGPNLIVSHLDLVFVVVWSIAFANIIGATIAFALSSQITRLAFIPFFKVMPFLLLLVTLGAIQTTQHLGNLALLLIFGVLGWLMRRTGIPRAPLLIGFVLSALVEQYLWQVVSRYGFEWLTRPGVLIIGAVAIAVIGMSLIGKRPNVGAPAAGAQPERPSEREQDEQERTSA
jgi:putative tricarboxylic transport membrane protein